MKKTLKILLSTAIVTTCMMTSMVVKAQSAVDELIGNALKDKTFYSYNMAYAAIMKLENINTRNIYLAKLAPITKDVLTPTVNNFTIKLEELNKISSGKLYDQIVADVSTSTLCQMDKGYLLGELTGWGKKLVYTQDYTSAVDKIVVAWNSLNKTDAEYNGAVLEVEKTLVNIKNNYNKDYLTEQLQLIKNIHVSTPQTPGGTDTTDGEINNQLTLITGQAVASKEQMISYFLKNNNIKGYDYISNFVNIVCEEASIEGIRADVVFAQMMKETAFLKFGGDVKEEQNNFAGIGAVGNGACGASFIDIRTGIRAVIQHLKAYASKDPLKQTVVDPRYSLVKKGSAPYVEWLGIKENPNGAGWASDKNYGYDIMKRVSVIAGISIQNDIAVVTHK